MKILLHFRHFIKPTREVEVYAKKKLQKLLRFNNQIMEVHVDIDAGKENSSESKYRVSVNLHLPPKHILHAEAKGLIPQAAVDLVYKELAKQIEKHTHKKRLSHKERVEREIVGQFPSEEEIEEIKGE